jgi:transposase
MPRSADPSRRKLWLARMQRHSQCDLTVAQFCRREGVSVPSFYHWKKKLAVAAQSSQQATAKFIPVRVTDPAPRVAATLRLPGGAFIELPSTLGHEQLAGLVAACVDATKPGTDSESVR